MENRLAVSKVNEILERLSRTEEGVRFDVPGGHILDYPEEFTLRVDYNAAFDRAPPKRVYSVRKLRMQR